MDLKAPDDADFALRERLTGDVYERSAFHRARLNRSGLGKRGFHRTSDLTRLAPMTLDDVPAAGTLLLQSARDRAALARRYQPLSWIQAGEVPLGYSDDDLLLLGDLGAFILDQAGLKKADLIANLLPSGASREHLQLGMGAQVRNISAVDLGTEASIEAVAALDPTTLLGEAAVLERVLEDAALNGHELPRLHTLLVCGDAPTAGQRRRFQERNVGVVRVWAPLGVLALWGQCRGGNAFHTWPNSELIETVDPVSGLPTAAGMAGHILWTGYGWYASAVIRLNTETNAVVHTGPCPTCGRRSPRLEPVEENGGFVRVLDESPHVQTWAAELIRTDRGDELSIYAVPAEGTGMLELLSDLNLKLGTVEVHLVDADEVARRVTEANGERFADHRSF